MTLADAVQDMTVAEEDVLRAGLYDLLAALLAKPPTRDLIDRVAQFDGDDGELGRAVGALTRLARATTETAAEREFSRLFIKPREITAPFARAGGKTTHRQLVDNAFLDLAKLISLLIDK